MSRSHSARDDYIELLPACWRAVNSYGIKISHRSYDCEELNPLRMQPSGVAAQKNLWEVRRDPYDVSRIFVRGPDGWITCYWRHLDRVPVPSANWPGTMPGGSWPRTAGPRPSSRSPTRSRAAARAYQGPDGKRRR